MKNFIENFKDRAVFVILAAVFALAITLITGAAAMAVQAINLNLF